MLEQHLSKGDYVYGFDFPSTVGGGGGPGMATVGITDSQMILQRTTTTRHGTFRHRKTTTTTTRTVDFRWIPWIDGKINFCFQQGRDVLSGWFSGCWMARYQEGGAARVCHIALQNNEHDCTAAWNAHKGGAGVAEVREFLPHRSVSKGTSRLGLVATTGDLYAIGMQAEKLDIDNPWTTPEDWLERFPMLSGAQAEEFAAKAQVPVSNVHPAGAWKVLQVKGPLRPGAFPA